MDKQPECEVTITPGYDTGKMTPEETEKFLSEHPTRAEVANFVGQYLANDILPQVIGYVNKQDNKNLALISMCEGILVAQGVISKEDMEALINKSQNIKPSNSKVPPGVVK